MDKKKVYVTKEGLEELKKEYKKLVDKERPDVVERVAQARAMGDLAENSEYAAAREALSVIDGRIEELSEIMKSAVLIEEKPRYGKKSVQLGSRVTVSVGRKKEMFTLVGEWEADPHEKKISHASPLGMALLGKTPGEKVQVEAPAGTISYTILGID